MTTPNNTLISIIESVIKKSLKNFEEKNEDNSLSDLYLHYDAENLTLSVYDDTENNLLEVNLENGQEDSTENFEEQVFAASKTASQNLLHQNLFEKEYIFKPFAISIVDDDFIVSEEILFIDDDTLKLDGDLFTKLDKELDDFLNDLLK